MGLLISLKKTLYVWWFELRCILLSSRFLVFSLVSFLLVHFYMRETLEFARDYDLNMYPAAISFLFADGTFSCLGILLAIFMLSVFPVTNHLQQNVLIQSGCHVWCTAQMLTIMSLVVIWLMELQIFVCVLVGGRLDFSGWGKVWGSCASGTARELGYLGALSVPRDVLMSYQPGEAVRLSMLFVFLMAVFFGEFIFCIDSICNRAVGEIVLSAWSFGYLIVANFQDLQGVWLLQKLSPKNWLDIGRYVVYSGGFREAVCLMCGLILLLFIVNHILVKKKIVMIQ